MRNGFTLIELLAVTVVIGIIIIIAVPSVNGIIKKAARDSFETSANQVLKSADIAYASDQLVHLNGIKVIYENGEATGYDLKYSGKRPVSGYIDIDKSGAVDLKIYDGTYCAVKSFCDSEVTISKVSETECLHEDMGNVEEVISRDDYSLLRTDKGDVYLNYTVKNPYSNYKYGKDFWNMNSKDVFITQFFFEVMNMDEGQILTYEELEQFIESEFVENVYYTGPFDSSDSGLIEFKKRLYDIANLTNMSDDVSSYLKKTIFKYSISSYDMYSLFDSNFFKMMIYYIKNNPNNWAFNISNDNIVQYAISTGALDINTSVLTINDSLFDSYFDEIKTKLLEEFLVVGDSYIPNTVFNVAYMLNQVIDNFDEEEVNSYIYYAYKNYKVWEYYWPNGMNFDSELYSEQGYIDFKNSVLTKIDEISHGSELETTTVKLPICDVKQVVIGDYSDFFLKNNGDVYTVLNYFEYDDMFYDSSVFEFVSGINQIPDLKNIDKMEDKGRIMIDKLGDVYELYINEKENKFFDYKARNLGVPVASSMVYDSDSYLFLLRDGRIMLVGNYYNYYGITMSNTYSLNAKQMQAIVPAIEKQMLTGPVNVKKIYPYNHYYDDYILLMDDGSVSTLKVQMYEDDPRFFEGFLDVKDILDYDIGRPIFITNSNEVLGDDMDEGHGYIIGTTINGYQKYDKNFLEASFMMLINNKLYYYGMNYNFYFGFSEEVNWEHQSINGLEIIPLFQDLEISDFDIDGNNLIVVTKDGEVLRYSYLYHMLG